MRAARSGLGAPDTHADDERQLTLVHAVAPAGYPPAMGPPAPERQRASPPPGADQVGLVAWAAAVLGVEWLDARVVATRPTSEVLALTTSTGSTPAAYLKLYRRGRGFQHERAALREWGPTTGRLPRVLAELPGPTPALLLRALPGHPTHRLAADDPRWPGIHQAAGR